MASLQELFDRERIQALKEYAALEWDLARLMQALLGIPQDRANLIFYRIVNTRSRYGIIDDLIALERPKLKPFWGRLEGLLQGADTSRNHVTHWMSTLDVADAQYYLLNPVSVLRDLPGAMRYGIDDLKAFGETCVSLALVVYRLVDFVTHGEKSRVQLALREIFLRPPENLKTAEFRQALFGAAREGPRRPLQV